MKRLDQRAAAAFRNPASESPSDVAEKPAAPKPAKKAKKAVSKPRAAKAEPSAEEVERRAAEIAAEKRRKARSGYAKKYPKQVAVTMREETRDMLDDAVAAADTSAYELLRGLIVLAAEDPKLAAKAAKAAAQHERDLSGR